MPPLINRCLAVVEDKRCTSTPGDGEVLCAEHCRWRDEDRDFLIAIVPLEDFNEVLS
jgi:hypothetical protein